MYKPQVYFVNGTAVAKEGNHVFKGVVACYGPDINKLKCIADVIELVPDNDNLYYLQKEGSGSDYGEKYLVASHGVTALGCEDQNGSIGAILSPIRSYNEYVENIQAIRSLLELKLDGDLDNKLLRLLYIGVCGELEGYLSSTIISLIQGVREIFLTLRECESSLHQLDEHKLREMLVKKINDYYQFHRIRNRDSKERAFYEMLGFKLKISKELFDDIEWRNKLAHRVPFYSKPIYPNKEDVLAFIEHANDLVESIDKQIVPYKKLWIEEL